MKKREAFTLIELVAVLVILAILSLIVTPLVLNIIKKARTAADKRSIDAYGRSIELAIADYLLDKGEFPTSIEQLTIEYTGDEVVCSTTSIKDDGSVYLAECTVAGRAVSGYGYGRYGAVTELEYKAYSVGDEVTYYNVDYRVIKNSSASESTVTLLKAEPLTYEEVQTYSEGTGASIYDNNGIGEISYHSDSSNYETSYIKATVDAWKVDKAPAAIEARLITKEEIEDNFEFEEFDPCGGCGAKGNRIKSAWMYGNYNYWTMSPYNDSDSSVWVFNGGGDFGNANVSSSNAGYGSIVVRPVIVLSKSVL